LGGQPPSPRVRQTAALASSAPQPKVAGAPSAAPAEASGQPPAARPGRPELSTEVGGAAAGSGFASAAAVAAAAAGDAGSASQAPVPASDRAVAADAGAQLAGHGPWASAPAPTGTSALSPHSAERTGGGGGGGGEGGKRGRPVPPTPPPADRGSRPWNQQAQGPAPALSPSARSRPRGLHKPAPPRQEMQLGPARVRFRQRKTTDGRALIGHDVNTPESRGGGGGGARRGAGGGGGGPINSMADTLMDGRVPLGMQFRDKQWVTTKLEVVEPAKRE
jgi:hypothetical protein